MTQVQTSLASCLSLFAAEVSGLEAEIALGPEFEVYGPRVLAGGSVVLESNGTYRISPGQNVGFGFGAGMSELNCEFYHPGEDCVGGVIGAGGTTLPVRLFRP
jgi:hypothetical protein